MTTAVFCAVVAVVSVVAALAAHRVWAWRVVVRKRVLVHSDATTFDGVLWARRGDLLVLRDVTTFAGPGSSGVATDGEVVVDRRTVDWLQVLS